MLWSFKPFLSIELFYLKICLPKIHIFIIKSAITHYKDKNSAISTIEFYLTYLQTTAQYQRNKKENLKGLSHEIDFNNVDEN
jgi:hypothetical protein